MTPGNGASRIKRGRVSWILVQGLPTLGADSGFRSLELEGETLSSTVTGNYGVARKEDLIEVAGCEFLRKQIC